VYGLSAERGMVWNEQWLVKFIFMGSLVKLRRLTSFLTGFNATSAMWVVKHCLILSVSPER